MTGGIVSMEMIDGVMMVVNGHFSKDSELLLQDFQKQETQ